MISVLILIAAYILTVILLYRFINYHDKALSLAGCICWPMVVIIMLVYTILRAWSNGIKGIVGDGK